MAIFALRNPKTDGTAAGQTTGTATQTTTHSTPHTSAPPKTGTNSSAPTTGGSSNGTSASTPADGKLPLVVLNVTNINHLAENAAQRFEAGGWTVTKFDSYTNDILSTAAYYDPDVPGAQTAAQALQAQFPAIKRVVPQFDDLAQFDSPIVVIVTNDYQP